MAEASVEVFVTPHSFKGVRAARDLQAGEFIVAFEGPTMPYAQVPEEEIAYVIWHSSPGIFLLPKTIARYINHSCNPNCEVKTLRVYTTKPLKKGEELTFYYNPLESSTGKPEDDFWDPRWSFNCKCGAANCQGRVDGYRLRQE